MNATFEPSDVFDTVVVGAGITGLTCARALVTAGQSVLVLEGRSRVGGRLLSDPATGLDLGASWFWPNEPRINAEIASLAIPTHQQHLAGDAMYEGPDGVQRLDGNPIDVASGRFSIGADSLALALRSAMPGADVRLEHTVTDVQARDSTMLTTTATSRLGSRTEPSSRHVVLALPPSLAIQGITFDPPLTHQLARLMEITPVWMGAVTKVVAVYGEPFWRIAGLSGAAISHVGPMREIHDMSGPGGTPAALFGFVSSASPTQPTVTPTEILDQLTTLFGSIAGEPDHLLIHDWRNEPLTSPPGVELLSAYQTYGDRRFGEPAMDGRLIIASTETSPVAPGHIEGAIHAGREAAATVLDSVSS